MPKIRQHVHVARIEPDQSTAVGICDPWGQWRGYTSPTEGARTDESKAVWTEEVDPVIRGTGPSSISPALAVVAVEDLRGRAQSKTSDQRLAP